MLAIIFLIVLLFPAVASGQELSSGLALSTEIAEDRSLLADGDILCTSESGLVRSIRLLFTGFILWPRPYGWRICR